MSRLASSFSPHATITTTSRPAKRDVSAAPSYDRSIIEGPLLPAVWRLACPSMLQNVIGGLQGVIDHAMVGHGHVTRCLLSLWRFRQGRWRAIAVEIDATRP